MQTRARSLPFVPLALIVSLLAAFLMLFSPLSASAHDGLVSSSPEADSTVDTLPAELTLTFSADLITGEGATEVVVTDAAGTSVTDGPATVEGAVVTQPLAADAVAGEYHVIWKVVSSDGHPTSDEYFFTVSTGTTPTAEPTAAAPTQSASQSAAPSASSSATPQVTSTDSPDAAADASPAIWIVSILGALVVIALIIWLLLRSRRNASPTDSAPSAER